MFVTMNVAADGSPELRKLAVIEQEAAEDSRCSANLGVRRQAP